MSEIVRLKSAEPVLFGVLKLRWEDGHEAIVDLRPVFAKGTIFAFLRDDPLRFENCAIDEWGNHVFWIDDAGDEVELDTIALRQRAERQAAILELAS